MARLDHGAPPCCLLTDRTWSKTRKASEIAGLNAARHNARGLPQLKKRLSSRSRNNLSWRDLISLQLLISAMNSNRTLGIDSIPAEISKLGAPTHWRLCSAKYRSEDVMLEDFRGGIIVAFHKNKGSKSDCGNNKGILFLSVARSLSTFTWTYWSRSPKWVSQRRNVASDRRAAPWTWYLVSGTSGEGHWAEQGPLLCLYRFHKGLWYSHQGGPLDGPGEIRLTKEVCDADPAASRQNERTGSLQRRPNSCLRKCS